MSRSEYVYRVDEASQAVLPEAERSRVLHRFKLLETEPIDPWRNTLLVGVFDVTIVPDAGPDFDELTWEPRDERWPNSPERHWNIRCRGGEWEDAAFGSVYQTERAIRDHHWFEDLREKCDEILARLGHGSRREHLAILGASDSPGDIKAAYRRLAAKHHPDHGGDGKKFCEIQAADAALMQ